VPEALRVTNAGSVGIPYEGDPDARWLLLGPRIEFQRTSYDVDAAIRQIESTGMPQAERVVESALRGRVSVEEATSFWEGLRTSAK
jgi:diadenosine tetraphosphatase ApaH/serine/threonine PP2A family protein phosphatase